MNLNYYEYVRMIADTGSLVAAAERLFVSQPALTQALKKMEHELGGPLFVYQDRKMTLTPLGQIVLETAKKIGEVQAGTQTRLGSQSKGNVGHMSIAINIQTGALLMGKIFPIFHRRYPEMMVHFITTSNNGAKSLLERRAVDFIYFNDFDPLRTDMVQHLLAEEPVLLALDCDTARRLKLPPGGKRPSEQSPVDILTVSQLPFIMSCSGTHFRHLVDSYLRVQGIRPYVVCENPNFSAIQGLAAEGIGAALIPSSLADFNQPGLVHYRLKDPLVNMLVLAHQRDYVLSDEANYFIETLKEYCRKNDGGSFL